MGLWFERHRRAPKLIVSAGAENFEPGDICRHIINPETLF